MTQMTAGAALRRIKKIKGEIAELDKLIKSSAVFLENKPPPFAINDLLGKRKEKVDEMLDLQTRLHTSNAGASFSFEGRTVKVNFAVRALDEIKALISLLQGLPVRDRSPDTEPDRVLEIDPTTRQPFYREAQKIFISPMTKVEQLKAISALNDEFDALNAELEACNHRTFI